MTARRPGSLAWLAALAAGAAAGLGLPACSTTPPGPAPEAAARQGTTGPVVLETEPWSFEGRSGQIIRTRWHRVFTTADDPVLLRVLPGFLEAALDEYTSAFGPLPHPDMRLDTFLLGSREEWESLTRRFMGESSATYLSIPRGGFATGGRALLWHIGRSDTLTIAAHEGWHQYTQRTFKESLPVWLEEGIAACMEAFTPSREDRSRPVFDAAANRERRWQLREAFREDRLMPLSELLATSPQDLVSGSPEKTLTYYAQVWALVRFLREDDDARYRSGLEAAVSDAAHGELERTVRERVGSGWERDPRKRGVAVFTAYFSRDLDEAQEAYTAFVRGIATEGWRRRRSGSNSAPTAAVAAEAAAEAHQSTAPTLERAGVTGGGVSMEGGEGGTPR